MRRNGHGASYHEPQAAIELVLQDAAFHGLAGDIVKTISPFTEAHPAALLIYFLVAFGNLINRSAHARVEHTEHCLNEFAVLVADTSQGKGTSRSTIDYMLNAVDRDWQSGRVKSGLSSGQGLIWNVRDPITESHPIREKGRVTGYQDVIVDQGEDDKRLFIVEEEFSQPLRMMQLDGNILSVVIRQAWDSGNLRTLTTGRKQSPVEATDAHISIVGHITKAELLRHLEDVEQANGFANRFLWFCVKLSKEIPNPTGTPDELLHPLTARIEGAVAYGRKTTEIIRDEKAETIWAGIYHTLRTAKPGLVGAIVARGAAQVMRLSCLYALLDLSDKVRPEHLLAALAVWDYSQASVALIFGDALGDPMADRILAALRASEEGLSETEIAAMFGRHNYEGIDRALGLLLTMGKIEGKAIPTAGRPKTVFCIKKTKA